MAIANLLVPMPTIPQRDFSWLGSIADSIGGAIDNVRADKSFTGLADRLQGGTAAPAAPQPSFLSNLLGNKQVAASPAMTAPVGPVDRGPAQGSTYQPFIDTVKTKVTNPYGLAAVAATGRAESGWSPANAARSWSDPSQSGQAGTAGGILSWRAERLHNLQRYAASKGEQGNGSPSTQAEFFLSEDTGLIDRLNSAQSPQEAQSIMNNAWKFAGYDQPGGETARRMALAQNYYAQDFRDAAPAQPSAPVAAPAVQPRVAGNIVASNDPSIGIPVPGATGQMRASDPAQVLAQPATPTAAAPSAERAMTPQAPAQAPAAPVQVADSGSNIIAPGVTPVARGGVDPSLIQYMLRDRNLRQTGLQLWAANAKGQNPAEPWQFVTLPDGTLARANQQTGAVEKLGNYAKPNDDATVVGDNLVKRSTGQVIYEGKPKTPQSFQEYQLAKQNGFTGSYADWEKVKVPGVTVNNSPGETATSKAAGEGLGKLFAGIFDQGQAAKQDKANVGLLRSTLANSPSGVLGGIASMASDYGVNVGPNADQVQVAKSIIAKMVPAQRVPGSGTTSDRDLAMFQSALPRLSGTSEGNGIILDTLDALADFKSAQADVVTRFYAGEIDQKQAVKELQALPDPFSAYKSFAGSNGGDTQLGVKTPKTDAEYNALPSGTIYIDPDDGKKYRKP